jgi:hypothetical protein
MHKRSSHVWDERFLFLDKEKKMNTQTETKVTVDVTETENPMQECHIGEVTESVEETAEAVLTARKFEIRDEAGSAFIP